MFEGFDSISIWTITIWPQNFRLDVPGEHVKPVYLAAMRLKMDRAAAECARFLASHLDLGSCLEIRSAPGEHFVMIQVLFFVLALWYFFWFVCNHFSVPEQWFYWPVFSGGYRDSNSRPLALDRTCTSALDRSAITSSPVMIHVYRNNYEYSDRKKIITSYDPKIVSLQALNVYNCKFFLGVTKPKSKSAANSDVDEAKTNGGKSKERKSSKELNKNGTAVVAAVASTENGKAEKVENGSKSENVQQPENGTEPEENGEDKTDVDLVSCRIELFN